MAIKMHLYVPQREYPAMLTIDALPAFNDNYIWLLQDPATRQCAVVDPGAAEPVLGWLAAHPDWRLTDILITHHHHDHVGGVARLKQHSGARVIGPAQENIPARDLAVGEGDTLEVLGRPWRVLHVPGHTLGHVAYYSEAGDAPVLFSGDTLFAAGCGRLFEGSPAQMHDSLNRLARLPDATRIYCAHEYTLSNLRFARAVEPHNEQVRARQAEVEQWRAAGRISLPSSLGIEKATNPFLRCDETSVHEIISVRQKNADLTPALVFEALRAWKDHF